MIKIHNRDYAYTESENQAGIRYCSYCGAVTDHPIEEAITAKVGDPCYG